MKKLDKLIITNRAALRRKYGNSARFVDAAVNRLIAADKKRGLPPYESISTRWNRG
jgi:hypothetical protein